VRAGPARSLSPTLCGRALGDAMTFPRLVCLWLLGTLLIVAAGCKEADTAAIPPVEPPTEPASVRLVPAAVTYGVGESVMVEARIDNGTNVGSITFRLRFDSDVLEYIRGVEGTFMNSDGSRTLFLASPTAGDEITVALSRLDRNQGASGSGLIVTLEFHAVALGDAGFAITAGQVKDPQARNLPAVFRSVPVLVVP
jgi:hypothetical protein